MTTPANPESEAHLHTVAGYCEQVWNPTHDGAKPSTPDAPTSGPEATAPWRGFGGAPVELTDKEALVIAGNTIKRLRSDLDQCYALLRPMHQSLATFVSMYPDDEDMPAVAIARDEIARCSKFLLGSSEAQTTQKQP